MRTANSKVLLNPFDSPAAVRSSNDIATGVLGFRDRLGIESGHQSSDAKRWGQAAGEVMGKVLASSAEGTAAAKRFGEQTLDRTVEAFRPVDTDGDGVADRSRAAIAADDAGVAIRTAATGGAGAVGSLFQRRRGTTTQSGVNAAEAEKNAD